MILFQHRYIEVFSVTQKNSTLKDSTYNVPRSMARKIPDESLPFFIILKSVLKLSGVNEIRFKQFPE